MTAPTEAEVRAKLHARIAAVPIGVERDDYASWGMEHGVLMSVADARDILALLDEARKDRERMDWLEASGCYVTTSDVDFTPAPLPNLRAAIDQARGA